MSESRIAIYGAIAANAAIALTKFVAAGVTGSGAMLSEGVHSLVDTGDGLLLLLGLRLGKRPPSEKHPYGHGLEVYFWSLVVAMAIFGMGGGVSIYEGILHVMHPRRVESAIWSYVVLGTAAIFEGISWLISVRAFRRQSGPCSLWTAIRRSKDPTTFVVVLEDSAALIGIVFAALGIALSRALGIPELDAVASMLIGLLLCTVAVILGRETWSLLVGESASRELVEGVRTIALNQPGVLDARTPRTMHMGPDIVHVDLDVQLDESRSGDELLETVRRLEDEVKRAHPAIKRLSLRFPAWT